MTAAERRASDLIGKFGITAAPIPVEEIARRLGAQLRFAAFDGEISGLLYRQESGAVIGVNSRHASTRQRFTIAHECGHLLMHEGKLMFIDRGVRVNWRNGKKDREERQANEFAAELLMPHVLVLAEVVRLLDRHEGMAPQQLVAHLADSFHVSAEAMSIRLSNLQVLDAYSVGG